MNIELISQAAQPVVCVRIRTSLEQVPEIFDQQLGAITSYLAELGAQPSSAPFAAYYNHDMHDLDMELGFPVAKALPGRGQITSGQLPAIEQAVCGLHRGSYASLHQTYEQIYQYIADHGFEQCGAHYDFYLNDPDNTPEQDLLTKVLIPVTKRGDA